MNPFKAYDIRGIYPYEVNENFAYKLGKATATFLNAKTLVIGRDGRISSDSLYRELTKGLKEIGINCISIGRCSTPQFYHAIYSGTSDGGIMITASHNPKEFNGFKICSQNARSVYGKNGLASIEGIMQIDNYQENNTGHIVQKQIFNEYVNFFKSLSLPLSKKIKLLVDTGNGMGITEIKALERIYPTNLEVEVINSVIDGTFPNHECDPTKLENTKILQNKLEHGNYDLGVALDGDGDRCVFFTSKGEKIPSDLLIAILAEQVAKTNDMVGYEVRTSQTVKEVIQSLQMKPKLYPSGHALIKSGMIKDGTVFAGEKSGHYFYRKLHFTDSTLYTMINILNLLQTKDLGVIAKKLQSKRSSLEEENYAVENKDLALEKVESSFKDYEIKKVDGLSVYGNDFFFNIRKSNTENLIRLNVESITREQAIELRRKIEAIISRI